LAQQQELIEALRDARPTLPCELNDRAQDFSEPLIAIADAAGGEWPKRARKAIVNLCGEQEDADPGVKLLQAINEVFNEMKADKLSTRELLERLVAKEDGPWAAWFEDALKHDKLKTAGSRLAGKLKRYKIKPDKLRFGEETANGYSRACFERAWKLNLP